MTPPPGSRTWNGRGGPEPFYTDPFRIDTPAGIPDNPLMSNRVTNDPGMSSESAAAVRTFFDHTSGRFDHFYDTPRSPVEKLVDAVFHKVLVTRFEATLDFLGPFEGTSVLDVGTGPGRYLEAFARRGCTSMVGLDFSQPMLDLARRRLEAVGFADRARLVCADFEKFAAGQERFDSVLAIGYLEYQVDPVATLRRMAELSRGKVVVSLPRRWTLLNRVRVVRYKLSHCPLRFFGEKDLDAMERALAPGWEPALRLNLGRDHLLGFRKKS